MLISLAMLGTPEFVLVLDDSPVSVLVKQDLETDFNDSRGRSIDFERARYLAYLQEEILNHTKIVKHTERTKLGQERLRGLPKYPAFRVNRYSDVQFFHEDMIYERGYQLLVLKKYIDEYYLSHELDAWKRRCKLVREADDARYCNEIIVFLHEHSFIDDFYQLFPNYGYPVSADLENDKSIEKATKKYGALKGFPNRKPMEYPPAPSDLTLMPWQEGYKYREFPQLVIGTKKSNIRD